MRGRHPVQGGFDFAAVGGIAAFGCGVVGAVQFENPAGGSLSSLPPMIVAASCGVTISHALRLAMSTAGELVVGAAALFSAKAGAFADGAGGADCSGALLPPHATTPITSAADSGRKSGMWW